MMSRGSRVKMRKMRSLMMMSQMSRINGMTKMNMMTWTNMMTWMRRMCRTLCWMMSPKARR